MQTKCRCQLVRKSRRSHGFSLVEVLIVVVILAILAATIIPKQIVATDEARLTNAKANLRELRFQIEFFKAQHDGTPPTLANIADQLTKRTDLSGAVAADGEFGPYLQAIPANPFNSDDSIVDVGSTIPPVAPAANGGWLYSEVNGEIWINEVNHLRY
jgi:prepilin-type N-terminal cleavage/methylation domain-containing protein